MRRWGAVGLASLAILWCATGAAQGQGARDPYVTFDVRERSLSEVLRGVAEETGQNLFFVDATLASVKVTLRVTQVHWRDVLKLLASRHGLDVEFGRSGARIELPKRIDLDLADADIRSAIQAIALQAGRNVVVAPEVTGTVSLHLTDVPWREALEAIAASRNLAVVALSERVFQVVPRSQVKTQRVSRMFQLRYLRPKAVFVPKSHATGVAGQMQPGKDPGREFSLLQALQALKSEVGSVTYDANTNTLFVVDSPPQVAEMTRIISALDVEPRQVFVDLKFVQTASRDYFDFGFRPPSGLASARPDGSYGLARRSLPFAPTGNGSLEDAMARRLIDGTPPTSGALAQRDGGADGGFVYGLIQTPRARASLALLQRDTLSRVIQAPKLLALDNRPATIFSGRELHFVESELVHNENGSVSLALKEARSSPVSEGFQLVLIPHVIPGTRKIMITLVPSNRVAEEGRTYAGGWLHSRQTASTYNIRSQSLLTQIMVESGQTAVVGGLMSIGDSLLIRKVPLLGSIPLIGHLFKTTTPRQLRMDLLIFVTPRLVGTGAETRSELYEHQRKILDELSQKLVTDPADEDAEK